jgi:hypothetical protein
LHNRRCRSTHAELRPIRASPDLVTQSTQQVQRPVTWPRRDSFACTTTYSACLDASRSLFVPYPEQARYAPHGMTEPQLISTADRAIDMNLSTLRFCEILSKSGEPTSGLEPLSCSLRVCGSGLPRVTRAYKSSMNLKVKNNKAHLVPQLFHHRVAALSLAGVGIVRGPEPQRLTPKIRPHDASSTSAQSIGT